MLLYRRRGHAEPAAITDPDQLPSELREQVAGLLQDFQGAREAFAAGKAAAVQQAEARQQVTHCTGLQMGCFQSAVHSSDQAGA